MAHRGISALADKGAASTELVHLPIFDSIFGSKDRVLRGLLRFSDPKNEDGGVLRSSDPKIEDSGELFDLRTRRSKIGTHGREEAAPTPE